MINVSLMIVQVSHKRSVLHEWLEQAEKEASKIVPAAMFLFKLLVHSRKSSKGCRKLGTEESY